MQRVSSVQRFSRRQSMLPLLPRQGFAVAACISLVWGCSRASDGATEALPPVIIGERVRVDSTVTGVVFWGEAGAVTSGARVDVASASTGQVVTATALEDGSFELELNGTPFEEFRVYATIGEQTSRAISFYGFTSDGEPGLAELELSSVSVSGFTLSPGTAILVAFGSSDINVDTGCNTHTATYVPCDDRLCVSERRATGSGCDPSLQAQDAWVSSLLDSSPRLTRRGPWLSLSSAEDSAEASVELIDGAC